MTHQDPRLCKTCGNNALSGSEISAVREQSGKEFAIFTPGIRMEETAMNDQKRVLSPEQALRAGADYLVVGRPITGSTFAAKSVAGHLHPHDRRALWSFSLIRLTHQDPRLCKTCGNNALSGSEISAVREQSGKEFAIFTPGIRMEETAMNDQKRVLSPEQALRAGADYLVVGRPITGSTFAAKSVAGHLHPHDRRALWRFSFIRLTHQDPRLCKTCGNNALSGSDNKPGKCAQTPFFGSREAQAPWNLTFSCAGNTCTLVIKDPARQTSTDFVSKGTQCHQCHHFFTMTGNGKAAVKQQAKKHLKPGRLDNAASPWYHCQRIDMHSQSNAKSSGVPPPFNVVRGQGFRWGDEGRKRSPRHFVLSAVSILLLHTQQAF